MRLMTVPANIKPREGDIKEERKFAWWPKRVADKLIWLENYTVVSKFVIRERIHVFQLEEIWFRYIIYKKIELSEVRNFLLFEFFCYIQI